MKSFDELIRGAADVAFQQQRGLSTVLVVLDLLQAMHAKFEQLCIHSGR